MPIYKVQDCGCIALPEDLQQRTGLGPCATFQMIVAEDGSSVTLNSIHPLPSAEIPPGVPCGRLEQPAK